MDKMKPLRNRGRNGRASGGVMKWVVLIVLVAVVGGVVTLMLTDLPAPTRHIEVAVPNDRSPAA